MASTKDYLDFILEQLSELEEFGAEVIPNQSFVIDKNIITSFCPETAPYVALNLLGMLMGEEKARVVSKAMGFSF